MKRTVLGILTALFFLLVGSAVAYEGTVELQSSSVACRATSVWNEERYKVIGKCDGLVYPYETQYEHYFLWAREVERNAYTKVGEIDRGYFEGNVGRSFDTLLITAEQDSNPRRPSEKEIVRGTVSRFAFDKSEVEISEQVQPDADTAAAVTSQNGSTVGRVLGRILTAILTIVLIVIAVVVVGSLVFRRRGSVST